MDNISSNKRIADDEALADASSLNSPEKKAKIITNQTQGNDSKQILTTSIFDLHQVVFHKIFIDYLNFTDLVNFDNAICNHIDRVKYFSLLEGMIYKNIKSPRNISNQFQWIHSRKLGCETAYINDILKANDVLELYPPYWPSIKTIIFSGVTAGGGNDALKCLLKCSYLKELTLDHSFSDNDISRAYMSTVIQAFDHADFCKHLRKVHLGQNFSIGEALVGMSKYCRNLVQIRFAPKNVRVADMMPFFIACGSTLEVLTYDRYSRDLFFGLRLEFGHFLKYCPNLKKVPIFAYNTDLIAAGQYCPHLLEVVIETPRSSLEINTCNNDGLISLFTGCHKVEYLNINYLKNLNDSTMIKVFQNSPNLKILYLSSLSITIKSLQSLAENCPLLRELSLSGLNLFPGVLPRFLYHWNFPNLVILKCNMPGLCDESILELVKGSPNLKSISLTCVNNLVTNTGMSHIAIHCHNLEYLSLDLSVDELEAPGVTDPQCLIDILLSNPRIKKSGFEFVCQAYLPLIWMGTHEESYYEPQFTPELDALLNSRV